MIGVCDLRVVAVAVTESNLHSRGADYTGIHMPSVPGGTRMFDALLFEAGAVLNDSE